MVRVGDKILVLGVGRLSGPSSWDPSLGGDLEMQCNAASGLEQGRSGVWPRWASFRGGNRGGDGGEGEREKLSVTLVLLQVGVHGSRVSRLLARVGLGWGVEGIFVEDKTEQDRTG